MMECLIVGYGSIGKRHAEILKSMGCSVDIVTSQTLEGKSYSAIKESFKRKAFDYVVVANPTYLHHAALIELIQQDYQGIVLVEKPLFSQMEPLPEHQIKKILVGYNLRFHELLRQVKQLLEGQKLITFSAYVGQYLPSWRKGTDYRNSYSAKKEQGGGVLRDLSHELDYTLWLCGPCLGVTAMGGHFSQLEINSDDTYSILMQCARCPIVNIQINYLDRCAKREITINTEQDTIFVDLMNGTLIVNGETASRYHEETRQTYIKQHRAIMSDDFNEFCSYSEGVSVINLIDAIEKSSTSRLWVDL